MTAKHEAFVNAYFENEFNATKAYQSVYDCTYETAMVEGCKHLRKPNIKEAIEKRKAKLEEKTDIKVSEIVDFLKGVMSKEDEATGNQLKAAELLGKYKAMFTDKSIVEERVVKVIPPDED